MSPAAERGSGAWTAVRVSGAADRAAASAALFSAGSQGVQEDGDTLLTHFPPDADLALVRHTVAAACPEAQLELSAVPQIDWTEAWKAGVRSHTLGTLTVTPPWLAEGCDPATTIVIEPGMAFGTGEHATTRGVVRLMQRAIRPGRTVADLGAGSAVLAIAAAKLGAVRVVAIEFDGDAIANAEENVARNGVAHLVTVFHGDAAALLPLIAPVDVVLANIISSVLVELLPAIARSLAPGGRAILSGILGEEREEMLALLDSHGWTVLEEDAEDIWWSASIARR